MTRMTGRTANCVSASTRTVACVVLVFESGQEMLIHAMAARKQFWDLLP